MNGRTRVEDPAQGTGARPSLADLPLGCRHALRPDTLLQVAFGSLFYPEPRLGIVDDGASEVTAAVTGDGGHHRDGLDDSAARSYPGVRRTTSTPGSCCPRASTTPSGGEKPDPRVLDRRGEPGRQPDHPLRHHHRSGPGTRGWWCAGGGRGGELSGPRVCPSRPADPRDRVLRATSWAGIFLPGSSLVEEKEAGTPRRAARDAGPRSRGVPGEVAARRLARERDGGGHARSPTAPWRQLAGRPCRRARGAALATVIGLLVGGVRRIPR